jgi:hypothetical protein
MKTLKAMRNMLAGFCLFGITQLASAGMISFDPTPALGNVGDVITVDVVWTGGPGEYLGDFDFDLSWDPAVVTWLLVFLDPDFGLDSIGLIDFGVSGPQGALNLYAVSFDSPADLIANQDSLGNTFRLVTFQFIGEADGQTPLTFGQTTFGDENGDAISPTLSTGLICVGAGGCAAVPEPLSISLMGIGLAGLAWSRRRSA